MIAIIDYDTGNLCSVINALHRLGADYTVTDDASVIRSAERVLLPGVGAADKAMDNLRSRGLDVVIPQLAVPVLGICVGMQVMCRRSSEGDTACLGIFDADVSRFPEEGLKVPHVGWNTIAGLSSPLFAGLPEESFVYYVHSYRAGLCDDTVAETVYGVRFSAALGRGNFYGTQFHPEKSGGVGETILRNFLTL